MQHEAPNDWFALWWEPSALLAAVIAHNGTVPMDEFFRKPGLKPLREAWAAAQFATIRSQSRRCKIRLIADIFPDFELSIGNELHRFELVEADRPGRRRADEYAETASRLAAGLTPTLEAYDPADEAAAAFPAIAVRIEQKARKRYRPSPHLLVYANFAHGEPTQLQAAQISELWRNHFASVWLLWGGIVFRLFPNPCKIRLHLEPAPTRLRGAIGLPEGPTGSRQHDSAGHSMRPYPSPPHRQPTRLEDKDDREDGP